jgi:His/Glu/Gln/Arg/opine family amino acid ABC transporter permease subunit
VEFDFTTLLPLWPRLLAGARVTVELTLVVLLLATPLAVLVALLRNLRVPLLAWPLAALSAAFRGVPPLLLLFIAFFGLPALGWKPSPFTAAAVAMAAYMAFYFGEVFRGALAAVPPATVQAATALGLSPLRIFFRIRLPLAAPSAIPPYVSHATEVLKGTALTAAIAVPELTGTAGQLFAVTFRPFEVLLAVALIYGVLDGVLLAAQSLAERRFGARAFAR